MEINKTFSEEIRNNPIIFINKVLGINPHPGQRKWIEQSSKRLVSFLRPGNRWGKTLSESLLHIWEACTKRSRANQIWSEDEWLRTPYDTLIFGPEYEQAREFLRLMVDITEGNIIINACPHCDSHMVDKKTAKDLEFVCLDCGLKFVTPVKRNNKSFLKGWAIVDDKSSAQLLPMIKWFNNAQTLGRSYSDMGKAFKMKALAFITGDECSDIQELYTFTTNTLLPRLASYNGTLHFVGTPQPDGLDYQRMIETAEDEMKLPNWETDGLYYVQKGSMYDNIYLDADYIKKIEAVSDPELRRQIIEGEFVNISDKYFGSDRINNMIDNSLQLIQDGLPGRKYITSVDFASGKSAWADFTVIGVIDYTDEQWKLVYYEKMKAKDIPVPAQYEKVREVVRSFKSKLIIDASGPGGKNAEAFLSDMYPISFEFGPQGSAGTRKMTGLNSFKTALDGGDSQIYKRNLVITDTGIKKDYNKNWGLLRIPFIQDIVTQMMNYSLDDTKLKTDTVMMLMMAVDWLMMRRPKNARNKAVSLDFLSRSVDDRVNPSSWEFEIRGNKAVDY